MLYEICLLPIHPRKRALDHADYTSPTRQHEPDHTDHTDHADHTDHTDQEHICSAWQISIMLS